MKQTIYLIEPDLGVLVGPGRFEGWLMRRHPDGYWVSVRKLERENLGLKEKDDAN